MSRIPCKIVNPGNYGLEERNSLPPCYPSKFLEWSDKSNIIIYVDKFDNIKKNQITIAVLVEPHTLCPENYRIVLEQEDNFDLIFTTYPDLINYGRNKNKYKYYRGGLRTFILPEERKVYKKKKEDIVCIMSEKRELSGHILRHQFKQIASDIVQFPKPFTKFEVLKDAMFEVIIENEDNQSFSEKIIDSMLCGCFPIYYNKNYSPEYLNNFDLNGIFLFDDINSLGNLIENNYFTKELYERNKKAIKYNFKEAKKWISFGDVIWNAGLKEYLK